MPLLGRLAHVCGAGKSYKWNNEWLAHCEVPRGTDTTGWTVCGTVYDACRGRKPAKRKQCHFCPEVIASKLTKVGARSVLAQAKICPAGVYYCNRCKPRQLKAAQASLAAIDMDRELEAASAAAPVPAPAPAFDMPDEIAAVVEALKTTPYAVLPPRTADTLLHVVLPSAAALCPAQAARLDMCGPVRRNLIELRVGADLAVHVTCPALGGPLRDAQVHALLPETWVPPAPAHPAAEAEPAPEPGPAPEPALEAEAGAGPLVLPRHGLATADWTPYKLLMELLSALLPGERALFCEGIAVDEGLRAVLEQRQWNPETAGRFFGRGGALMAQEEEFPAWELPGQAAAATRVVRPLACARLLPTGSPRQCPECQAYWHSSLRKVHRTLVSEEQVAKRDAAAAGPSSDFPIRKLPREVLEERLRNTSKELQACKAKLKYGADALKLSKADTAELRNTVLKADAALKGEAGSECDLQGANLLMESGNGAMYKPGSAFRNYWDDCVRAAKLPENSTGMRFHPTTIRFAVSLFTTSRKAYRLMADGVITAQPRDLVVSVPNTSRVLFSFWPAPYFRLHL